MGAFMAEKTWPRVERRLDPPPPDCDGVYRKLAVELDAIKAEQVRQGAEVELMKTAFLVNDLGAKAYEGHRQDHLRRQRAEQTMEVYKQEGFKTFLRWVITGLLAAWLLGAGDWIKSIKVGG